MCRHCPVLFPGLAELAWPPASCSDSQGSSCESPTPSITRSERFPACQLLLLLPSRSSGREGSCAFECCVYPLQAGAAKRDQSIGLCCPALKALCKAFSFFTVPSSPDPTNGSGTYVSSGAFALYMRQNKDLCGRFEEQTWRLYLFSISYLCAVLIAAVLGAVGGSRLSSSLSLIAVGLLYFCS